MIPNTTEEDTSGVWKMWSFALWWYAFNSSHDTLSQHVLSLLVQHVEICT